MKERSLGGSKFWVLIVDDYSDYIWGRLFNKRSDLSDNVMQILKKYSCKERKSSTSDLTMQVKTNHWRRDA